MRIILPAQARQTERITLETARQDSDRSQEHQPIDPLRFTNAAARQLEHPRLLIPEQLLTAEALLVAPDQIEVVSKVDDQKPRLLHRQAGGMGDHQAHALADIDPEAHTT